MVIVGFCHMTLHKELAVGLFIVLGDILIGTTQGPFHNVILTAAVLG
jgi:hypothetical protein